MKQKIFITGASGGIGSAIAKKFNKIPMKIPINEIEIIEQTKIFLSFIELKITPPNG